MKTAAMQRFKASEPFEVISMDFLHIDKVIEEYQYLLVITDNFAKFTQVYVTKTKKVKRQQIACIIISFHILEFQGKLSTTR